MSRSAVAEKVAPGTDRPLRPPSRSGRLGRVGPPALVLAALLIGWQTVTTLAHVNPTILPGPRLIVASTFDDRANLWPAITTTTTETLLGLLLAVVIALVIGTAIHLSRTARGSLYPLIVASQTLPIITLAPLMVIWFGFGLLPKILLVGFFSFFPITVGLVSGLGSVDADAVNLLRTMRATRLQVLLRVSLPGALPQLFTGLKISVTYAFASAVVAEFVGATQGIGVYMTSVSTAAPVRTDLELGATFVVSSLTIALFVLVSVVQRLAMPWRPPGES
jgi:ABC-type nitrate/sulfonate/bicarbonate transport system permease component